jgi:hypothetical protein
MKKEEVFIMNTFTKGFICGIGIVMFGKIMYEIGKHKDSKTAKQVEKLVDALSSEEEES